MRKEGTRSGLITSPSAVILVLVITILLVSSAGGEGVLAGEFMMENLVSERLLAGMSSGHITYDALGKQSVCSASGCVNRVNNYNRPCIYRQRCRQ